MYRGFNLRNFPYIKDFYEAGKKNYDKHRHTFTEDLDKFISADNEMDASKLQDNWFPQKTFDIFISHSHSNIETAIALAGFLNEMGLTCFVDSYVWGHADKLLKKIDSTYCLKGTGLYDYETRNYTTSHVHMMLSNALSRMIDNCECIFFLNTPDSISVESVVNKTVSPWIYTELYLTKIIRQKKRENRFIKKGQDRVFSESLSKKPIFQYDVDLSHLTTLAPNDIRHWASKVRESEEDLNNQKHPLDLLYNLYKD